jgi:hypothetical protein
MADSSDYTDAPVANTQFTEDSHDAREAAVSLYLLPILTHFLLISTLMFLNVVINTENRSQHANKQPMHAKPSTPKSKLAMLNVTANSMLVMLI